MVYIDLDLKTVVICHSYESGNPENLIVLDFCLYRNNKNRFPSSFTSVYFNSIGYKNGTIPHFIMF